MISTTNQTCNNASLDVFVPSEENPWNIQKVNHLYRRVTFGATPEMLKNALEKTPAQVVAEIIDQAKNAIEIEPPEWVDWIYNDFGNAGNDNIRHQWATIRFREGIVEEIFANEGGLNDRLILFWSNHLVASNQGYLGPPYFYKYYNLLERKSIGNFKELVYDVGTLEAMLEYLNGFENVKGSPNENYARELLELFTLGRDNGYTQGDIEEIARALTGWNKIEDRFGPITFDPDQFDAESKTFLGRTGEWGYDDVIDILFEEREQEIAQYICGKLYTYFVSDIINEDIVNELANTFRSNNFEIAPVLEQLFKSQHFFDEAATGVLIKSPLDLEVGLQREMNLTYHWKHNTILRTRDSVDLQGQAFYNHGSVEGWPGGKEWINSSTLVLKWEQLTVLLEQAWLGDEEQFKVFLNGMLGSTSNDVEFVTQSILDFFFTNQSIDAITYQGALVAFKDNVPQNYFEDGSWNTQWSEVSKQMYMIMLYIIRIPEFQLK